MNEEQKRDCDHGRQLGKCDTCDLLDAEKELESLKQNIWVRNQALDILDAELAELKQYCEQIKAERDTWHRRATEQKNEMDNIIESESTTRVNAVLKIMKESTSDYLWTHNKLEIQSNLLNQLLQNFCEYHEKQQYTTQKKTMNGK